MRGFAKGEETPQKNAIGDFDNYTIEQCNKYLSKYPNGMFADKVRNRLKLLTGNEMKLDFDKCKTVKDYDNFIVKYGFDSGNDLVEKARQKIFDIDMTDIKRCYNKCSALYQYQEFIERFGKYKDNEYVVKAVKKIDEKKREAEEYEKSRKGLRIFMKILVVIVMIFVVWGFAELLKLFGFNMGAVRYGVYAAMVPLAELLWNWADTF